MSPPRALDLDADSRDALEIDAALAYAASFAATAPGRAAIASSPLIAELDALTAEHEAWEQAGRQLARAGRLVSGGLPDPRPALAALAVEGLPVEPVALRDLASILLEGSEIKKRLSLVVERDVPLLLELGANLPDLATLARPMVRFIRADGGLEDDASAELQRIRQSIARTGDRLRRQLESFVRDPAAASSVRDDFVTQRNGRFVIPVRADAPRGIDGIVHAASSSGQTLFVEPLESVALNNDLVRLAEQEAQERERVVSRWAASLRARAGEVEAAVAAVARADVWQARALFARAIEGVRPGLAAGGPFRLDRVRHPLLDRRLRERGERCVPISLALEPYDRVMVVSGPNTGGKTVALRTAGLAAAMAQAGLPVAAEAAALPVFAQIRADIGDHQSIEADLSTFSAHVRAVDRYLAEAAPPALMLFDEIGTGTEPGEGAALAQAILERLLALGVTGIATTHLGALKAWAFANERVASAALEFDEATLKPTFRVLAGAAGASAGLAVASRLGLDPALVARARSLVGEESLRAESYMARLRSLTSDLEARRDAIETASAALDAERERIAREAREEGARAAATAQRRLDEALREFREAARREIATLTDAKEKARVERAQRRAEGRLADGAARVRAASDAAAPADAPPAGPFLPSVGGTVRIRSLGREGVVVALRGTKAEVRMGTTTFTVSREDLGPPRPAEPAPAPKPSRAGRLAALAAASRPGAADAPLRPSPPLELHLLGMTVEEALPELDKFLDACAREGRDEARVVHGHGTGRLRAAVRRHLKGHAAVGSFRPGAPNEGGDGATVVTLA